MKKYFAVALILSAFALNASAGVVRYAYNYSPKKAAHQGAFVVSQAAKKGSYPVRHPKKSAKASEKSAKAAGKAIF